MEPGAFTLTVGSSAPHAINASLQLLPPLRSSATSLLEEVEAEVEQLLPNLLPSSNHSVHGVVPWPMW